jgi:hypothetical protein
MLTGFCFLLHHVVEKMVYLKALHLQNFFKMANKSANNIPITQHDAKVLLSIPVGSAWMELRPNFLESVQEAKDLVSVNPS